MTTSGDRLTTLEIRNAEQEQVIEELSEQLAEQWKVIDRMQKKLDVITYRFLVFEEQTALNTPTIKPPHW